MSRELRELIGHAGAQPSRPLNTGILLRRGRRLRWRRRLIVTCTTAAVSVAAFAVGLQVVGREAPSNRTAPAAGERADYSIARIQVGPQNGQDVRVAFSLEWTNNEFPGIRNCTITVYDRRGEVVGKRVLERVYKMSPGAGTLGKEVAVPGTASSADVSCGERLDDPNGRYEITNIAVKRSRIDSEELLVSFDSKWTGATDVTGIATCKLTVYDGGTVVLQEDTTYSSEGQSASSVQIPLMLPSGYSGTPTSADVSCSPFSG